MEEGASQGEYERGSVIAAVCMIGYIENEHDFVKKERPASHGLLVQAILTTLAFYVWLNTSNE